MRELNVLSLGDEIALSLGSRVEWQRSVLLLTAVALAGASVATAGSIGFVDLMAPHLARQLVSSDHRALLPVSALTGGAIVVLADLVGCLLFAPIEIPCGLITAVIGAPYFVYLLIRNRSRALAMSHRLEAQNLTLGYNRGSVVSHLNLAIPAEQITVLVGPNGCGKSTLLRGLARLLKPKRGQVCLDGADIFKLSTRSVAKRLAMLPQNPIAPEGLTVRDLVAQGRYPYQTWWQQWSQIDEKHVEEAIAKTDPECLCQSPC